MFSVQPYNAGQCTNSCLQDAIEYTLRSNTVHIIINASLFILLLEKLGISENTYLGGESWKLDNMTTEDMFR